MIAQVMPLSCQLAVLTVWLINSSGCQSSQPHAPDWQTGGSLGTS